MATRKIAESWLGTRVKVWTSANGHYVGILEALTASAPWRGRVRITGTLKAACVFELGHAPRAGFRPGDVLEAGSVSIQPTTEEGVSYLTALETELAEARAVVALLELQTYQRYIGVHQHIAACLADAVAAERAGTLRRYASPFPWRANS